ncbi:MAG: hypothetical protein IH602_03810 [Bryobacteraceae bacterium]|nr:hypothetical protein [Bryobacteraceae bacterium]
MPAREGSSSFPSAGIRTRRSFRPCLQAACPQAGCSGTRQPGRWSPLRLQNRRAHSSLARPRLPCLWTPARLRRRRPAESGSRCCQFASPPLSSSLTVASWISSMPRSTFTLNARTAPGFTVSGSTNRCSRFGSTGKDGTSSVSIACPPASRTSRRPAGRMCTSA